VYISDFPLVAKAAMALDLARVRVSRMRIARYISLVLCGFVSLLAYAQKEDWLPITPQDLQYKEVPGNKGAAAVRLYYAQHINDNTSSWFIYERVKLLNEKALNPDARGKTYADVEIPLFNFDDIVESITDLKARTIKPDGTIVEFNGKPFEKVIFKSRGNKISVLAFSMPEASVGSIVEYRYRRTYLAPGYSMVKVFAPGEWDIQSELHTVKESLYYQPFDGGGFQSMSKPAFYFDGAIISRVVLNLKDKPRDVGSAVELELSNVPAFETEEFMPPENNFKPAVIFFYNQKGSASIDKEWQEIGKERYEVFESFMANNRGVKEEAAKAIAGESEQGMKLRKIYQRTQQIRNLTFEHFRTKDERKQENLLRNQGVGDVLAHGYGYNREITLLFVAMARAAGFDASVVQVSDRRERFFAKEWTSVRQIDNVIAAVNVNGADLYLEPGTRFCPYGFLRWNHTATDGLKLDKKGGTFIKAPPVTYDKSVIRRTAQAMLEENGTLKADVTIEFRGAEALEHRLDERENDDAGRKKDLEDELKEWLPKGAIVKMVDSQGWDGTDEPLAAKFNVEVPDYASTAGKRLLAATYLFQLKQNQAFTHGQRKYPVYFPYPFTETDSVSIQVPPGFTIESVPSESEARLPYARYKTMSQFDGSHLVTQRNLFFNGVYFPLEKYSELKGFFGTVQAGDEQQAVLHAGGSASAQKGN
jgi:Domain of Unknown Function with PDB structure (DUF3857)/Transglutaminase-like superfamily